MGPLEQQGPPRRDFLDSASLSTTVTAQQGLETPPGHWARDAQVILQEILLQAFRQAHFPDGAERCAWGHGRERGWAGTSNPISLTLERVPS